MDNKITNVTILANAATVLQSSAIVTICCLSPVMQVYCDKTTEARIMQFTLKSSTMSKLLAW